MNTLRNPNQIQTHQFLVQVEQLYSYLKLYHACTIARVQIRLQSKYMWGSTHAKGCKTIQKTVQFPLKDVTFFHYAQCHWANCLEMLRPPHHATLKLYNHKNEWIGVCIYQEHNGNLVTCLVLVLGRCYICVCNHTPN